jgi:hypothetical protein
MKQHPAAPQLSKGVASGSAIPWSAEREYRLRRGIQIDWLSMWVCLISGLLLILQGSFWKPHWPAAVGAGFLFAAIFLLLLLQRARADLGEEMRRLPDGSFYEGSGMLANKPRSTANLTQWLLHPRVESVFLCRDCSRLHQWKDARFYSTWDREHLEDAELFGNFDPGSGRWVILCPCGLGHYKLKA